MEPDEQDVETAQEDSDDADLGEEPRLAAEEAPEDLDEVEGGTKTPGVF